MYVRWVTYRCPSCNARTESRIVTSPRAGVEYKKCRSCNAVYRTPDIEWSHMTTGQRVGYFLNEWAVAVLAVTVLSAAIMWGAAKPDWQPSAWTLAIGIAFCVPFWLWKLLAVQRSKERTTRFAAQQSLGDIQGLDNLSHASATDATTPSAPPVTYQAAKRNSGWGWKVRVAVIGMAVVWGILGSQWKAIDKYFPKLNEYIHSGTPTSEGDVDYLMAHLRQDMAQWGQTCPEKIGFQECRTRLISNKPVLSDLNARVTALDDAWSKELSERTVSKECQARMNQLLTGYKDYVRAENNIVALIEPISGKVEDSNLQPLNAAFGQEDKALNELHNVKASNACDSY